MPGVELVVGVGLARLLTCVRASASPPPARSLQSDEQRERESEEQAGHVS